MKISKMLKHGLRLMKKQEFSSLECTDPTLIKYGRDDDILIKQVGSIPQNVKYIVKLYTFTEGKNTFNMTIDEKI